MAAILRRSFFGVAGAGVERSSLRFAHGAFSELGLTILLSGLVMLGAASVLLATAYHGLRRENAAVQKADKALLQLAKIDNLIIGVDYSARGYALTGLPMFYDHEMEKQDRLRRSVSDLAGMVDVELLPQVQEMSADVAQHAAVYAEFIKHGRGQTREIAAIITDPVVRQKRLDVQRHLGDLHKRQLTLLYAHQAKAEKQLRYTGLLTILIVAIAFLGGVSDVIVRLFLRNRSPYETRAKAAIRLPL